MARIPKSFGYTRQNSVPDIKGTKVKVCRQCKKWFAAGAYEQTCDGCVRPQERTTRTLARRVGGSTKPVKVREFTPGQRHVLGHSQDLCRELAREAAQDNETRYRKAHPPMTKAKALRITARNVELGLQGACDLERYS